VIRKKVRKWMRMVVESDKKGCKKRRQEKGGAKQGASTGVRKCKKRGCQARGKHGGQKM